MMCRKLCAATLVAVCVVSAAARADVVVAPSEVVEGSYSFVLGLTDIGSGGTRFDAALSSRSNIIDEDDPISPGVRYIRAAPGSSLAEFTVRWDFSGTSFRPAEVTFFDKMELYRLDSAELVLAESSWSLDGLTYNTIRALQTVPSQIVVASNGFTTVDLGVAASEVWYRMTFRVLPGDNNGVFDRFQNQWGRSYIGTPEQSTVFSAAFAACTADFNWSGSLSVQDIFDFLAAYFGGDTRADFNGSGAISVQDIFDFLAAYFAGCN